MGLALEVGFLADMIHNDVEGAEWFRQELAKINTVLAESGLPQHIESEDCEIWSCDMFGYSGLHYLRRIAAHLNLKGRLPAPGDESASDDPVLDQYYSLADQPKGGGFAKMFRKTPIVRHFDHLIYHNDAEGFYVPLHFSEVLFPPNELQIPGDMIGSTVVLREECARLAEALELPLELDHESDEIYEAADTQGEGEQKWQQYGVESFTCLRLLRACEHSILHKSILVFC